MSRASTTFAHKVIFTHNIAKQVMKRPYLLLFTLLLTGKNLLGQEPGQWKDIAYKHALISFKEFYDLLSLPNDARYPDDIEKNVQWCEDAYGKRGFKTSRLQTPTIPMLFAERRVADTNKTVLIYLQLDGQPVRAELWEQDNPWTPVLKERDSDENWTAIPYEKLYSTPDPEWRIFARSTSDSKGPVTAYLAALDALEELGQVPDFNIKVIMDFEEEKGSPHLAEAVNNYKNELTADWLIIFDGPRHVSNQPTLKFGARGISTITLTTFGPRVPVHSGNYGNYTPNPALRLAQLLAGMKDEHGVVTLPGFYDGIEISDEERKILSQVPDDEQEIKQFLGIASPDKVGNSFQESLQYPSLNIRGLNALFVGNESRTLIPATATAEVDIRLVPSSDPDRLIGLVRKYVEDQGYYIVADKPTEEERRKHAKIAAFQSEISYRAFQTPFDSECGIWLNKAMLNAFGKEPVKIRISGGSIPISPFVSTLGIPAVTVSTVNADNNQHSENENIRVGNYIEAVKTFLSIMLEKTKD